MYKLVALDMDGTLLNDDKMISNENRKAISKAIEKGVRILLATGRPIKGIQNYLKELNLVNENDYAVYTFINLLELRWNFNSTWALVLLKK